jgi:purine-binding chemotaxis protein CheW
MFVHAPPTTSPAGPVRHFVIVEVNGLFYALPLENVSRALRMVAITPVPDGPRWSPGIIDIAGKTIPVLDLRLRFEHHTVSIGLEDQLLIVDNDKLTFALIVDRVVKVIEKAPGELMPPPAGLAGSRPLLGSFRDQETLILALDVHSLLAPDTFLRGES